MPSIRLLLQPAALRLLAVLCVLPALLPSASAHTDEHFATLRTPHGGQMTMAGPLHLELVVDPRELTLYLTDHGEAPVAAAGGSAKAIITGGKERYVVLLSPAGENVLKGKGEYKLGQYNLIQLMVALPDQDLQHAKFVHPKGATPPKRAARKKGGKKKKARRQ
jgi:hypothetical protein